MIQPPIETLTQINLDDLVSSFGWEKYPLPASILRFLFAKPARKFAGQMVEFDHAVGTSGLAGASKLIMHKYYVRDVRVHGQENIPRTGPVLFLSNHPGMADTISLFAAIDRADLNIIAVHRPFLAALENTTKKLYFISEKTGERMRAIRQVSNHLRNGGAALTFPAGEIEPDPLVYPGALESLDNWTDSAGVFLRFERGTKIVPVLVSGVVWERSARHWLTHIKRTRYEREKFAAALQLLAMVVLNVKPSFVRVRFAKPITLAETGSTDSNDIHRFVLHRMRDLINSHPKNEGVSVF